MDKPAAAKETLSMNPFAKPKKKSLIVREAIRSGAADGVPYYGSRKSAVWVPQAEDTGRSQLDIIILCLLQQQNELIMLRVICIDRV